MQATVRIVGRFSEVRQAIRAARIGFVQEQRPILEALGVQTLSLSRQDYVVKSRGGTGKDGIKWKPLAQSTIDRKNRRGRRNASRPKTASGKARPTGGQVAIGIDSGLQLASSSPGYPSNVFKVSDKEVVVGYNREYSEHYDEKRPLMPEKLTPAWEAVLDSLVLRWALALLKSKLAQFKV